MDPSETKPKDIQPKINSKDYQAVSFNDSYPKASLIDNIIDGKRPSVSPLNVSRNSTQLKGVQEKSKSKVEDKSKNNEVALKDGPQELHSEVVGIGKQHMKAKRTSKDKSGSLSCEKNGKVKQSLLLESFKGGPTLSLQIKSAMKIFSKENTFTTAIAQYSKLIASEEMKIKYLLKRALCYLKLGRFEPCIDDCTLALFIDNTYSDAYWVRIKAHEEVGNDSAALYDCCALITYNPTNAKAFKKSDHLYKKLTRNRGLEKYIPKYYDPTTALRAWNGNNNQGARPNPPAVGAFINGEN